MGGLSDELQAFIEEEAAYKQSQRTITDNENVGEIKGHNKDSFMSRVKKIHPQWKIMLRIKQDA